MTKHTTDYASAWGSPRRGKAHPDSRASAPNVWRRSALALLVGEMLMSLPEWGSSCASWDQMRYLCESRGVEEAMTASESREDEGKETVWLSCKILERPLRLLAGEETFHLEEESMRRDRGGKKTLRRRNWPLWQRAKQMKRGILYVAFVPMLSRNSFPLHASSFRKS